MLSIGSFLGKSNVKIIGIVTTIFCMSTVVSDWLYAPRYNPAFDNRPAVDRNVSRSSIAKISMLYGETNSLYERALAGHIPHNKNFGYSMYVLREKTLPGYWSKPAYILDQLLAELALPETQRLQWLV